MMNQTHRERYTHQSGVGLIEILIAILIFSFGILGLVGLQARATQFSVSAEDTNRAALLANEAGAVMWQNQTASMPADAYSAWQRQVGAASGPGLPNGEGTIAVNGNIANIEITWRSPSAASNASNKYVTQVVIAP